MPNIGAEFCIFDVDKFLILLCRFVASSGFQEYVKKIADLYLTARYKWAFFRMFILYVRFSTNSSNRFISITSLFKGDRNLINH